MWSASLKHQLSGLIFVILVVDQTGHPNTTNSCAVYCGALHVPGSFMDRSNLCNGDKPPCTRSAGGRKRGIMIHLASDLQKLAWPSNLDKTFLLLFAINKYLFCFFFSILSAKVGWKHCVRADKHLWFFLYFNTLLSCSKPFTFCRSTYQTLLCPINTYI